MRPPTGRHRSRWRIPRRGPARQLAATLRRICDCCKGRSGCDREAESTYSDRRAKRLCAHPIGHEAYGRTGDTLVRLANVEREARTMPTPISIVALSITPLLACSVPAAAAPMADGGHSRLSLVGGLASDVAAYGVEAMWHLPWKREALARHRL